MNLLRRIGVLGTLIGLCTLAAPPAFACSCTGVPPVLEALGRADAAFSGEVLDVRYKASFLRRAAMRTRELWAFATGTQDAGLQEWYKSPDRGRVARLRVTEAFKGAKEQIMSVHFSQDDDCLGYRFVVGEKYLVFAWHPLDEPGSSGLRINSCGLTQRQVDVPDRVAELRAWARRGEQ